MGATKLVLYAFDLLPHRNKAIILQVTNKLVLRAANKRNTRITTQEAFSRQTGRSNSLHRGTSLNGSKLHLLSFLDSEVPAPYRSEMVFLPPNLNFFLWIRKKTHSKSTIVLVSVPMDAPKKYCVAKRGHRGILCTDEGQGLDRGCKPQATERF